jgi:hypothetical protein
MRVWKALPRRLPEEIKRDPDRFAYADILREAAQRMTLSNDERKSLRREALAIFDSIREPSQFHLRKKAQLLVEMDHGRQAVEILVTLSEDQEPFKSYWLSKAHFAQMDFDAALVDIDRALSAIGPEDGYWSTFKAQRFEVQAALEASDAVNDLKDAISTCKNERFRQTLENRLSAFEKRGQNIASDQARARARTDP